MPRKAGALVNTPRLCDVYTWVEELEREYNCSVSLHLVQISAQGQVGKVRVVAECQLAATGICERFTLRESTTVPAASTKPIEWALYDAVLKLHTLVTQHPQSKFRLRHP